MITSSRFIAIFFHRSHHPHDHLHHRHHNPEFQVTVASSVFLTLNSFDLSVLLFAIFDNLFKTYNEKSVVIIINIIVIIIIIIPTFRSQLHARMFNIQYGNRHKGMKRGLIQWWNTKWRILHDDVALTEKNFTNTKSVIKKRLFVN